MIKKEEVNVSDYDNSEVNEFTLVVRDVVVLVSFCKVHQDTVYRVQDERFLSELAYLRKDEGPTGFYYLSRAERLSMVRARTYRKMCLLQDIEPSTSVVRDDVYKKALRLHRQGLNTYIVVFGLRDDSVARLEIGETTVPIPVRYTRRLSKPPSVQ